MIVAAGAVAAGMKTFEQACGRYPRAGEARISWRRIGRDQRVLVRRDGRAGGDFGFADAWPRLGMMP